MATEAEKAAKSIGVEAVKLVKFPETAPQEAINSKEDWKAHVEATQHIPEVTLDDLEWADALIFSYPTRYGSAPSQVQSFFDTTGGLWFNGKLANKVVSGMTSAQNPHGGQESTLLDLYKSMYHWGAIVAAPGYTNEVIFGSGGNPYGLSVAGGKDNVTEDKRKSIAHQVTRTVNVAKCIKEGM